MPPISDSIPSNSGWPGRAVSAAEAGGLLHSGMSVFVHGACATPTPLLDAMVRRTDLDDLRLYHLHLAVVTEFGAENIHGMTQRERDAALISIAHPDFRTELAREFATIRHIGIGGI